MFVFDTYWDLRRGHVKILERHCHSAGLVDFYVTLTYILTIEWYKSQTDHDFWKDMVLSFHTAWIWIWMAKDQS